MKKRKYLYAGDHIDRIPFKITKNNLDFYYIREYPKFYLYEHSYGNGNYKECFDKHDIQMIARYGYC